MEVLSYFPQFRRKQDAEPYNFFECDFCALMFRSKAELNLHTIKHFERKICNYCGKILIRICNDWYELHAAANCDREYSSCHPSIHDSVVGEPLKLEKIYLSSDGEEADHCYEVDHDYCNDHDDRDDSVDNSEPVVCLSAVQIKSECEDGTRDNLLNLTENPKSEGIHNAAVDKAIESKNVKAKAGPKSWKKQKEKKLKRKKPKALKNDENVDVKPSVALTRIDSDGEEVPIPPPFQPKLKCPICDKELLNKRTLGYHLRDVHNYNKKTPKRYYTCDICARAYTTFRSLKVHMYSHAGTKPFVCTSCGRGFYQMTHLRKHELIHTGERPHVCHLCGKTFKSRSNLQAHTRIHTGEKPYNCKIDKCERAFANRSDLKRHEHTAHGMHDKKYSCPICARPFFENQWMQKHMQTHNKIVVESETKVAKEHICEYCSKSFTDRSRLQAHLRSHTGEKPYRCKIENCARAYAYQTDLKRHEHKDHGLHIKYKCAICPKSFFETKSLVKHMIALHRAEHIKAEN